MADKSIAKRTKRWAGRGSAIRYRWHERWSDWWCATRDARSCLPATLASPDEEPAQLPPVAMTKLASRPAERIWCTPRTASLVQLGRGQAEQEWIRYQAETADLQVARAQVAARREVADRRLAAAQERLDSMAEQPKEPAAVVAGEENAGEDVRIGRRKREHAARRQALQAEIRQSRDAVEAAKVDLARLDEQIQIRRSVAEVRVAMIEAYVRRRCSAYLSRLIRKHPDGARIGALLRSGWSEQPSWLSHPPASHDGGA